MLPAMDMILTLMGAVLSKIFHQNGGMHQGSFHKSTTLFVILTFQTLDFLFYFLSFFHISGRSLLTSEADTHFLPSITEWHVGDHNRSVTCKRRFIGLGTIPNRQLTFDNNGKILVAGNQHCLKFWDVNFADCLWTTSASHELQVCMLSFWFVGFSFKNTLV